MKYSRRHFVQAAASGITLTALGAEKLLAATSSPPARSTPMTKEKSTFIINGKSLVSEYEARTTLWEVVAVNLGLTGTTRAAIGPRAGHALS